jgi:DNA adenine methylase
MSFGSDIFKGFAFNERGEGNRTSNKRQLFTPEIKERLGKVEIFNRDALELIKTKDSPDTFFYLDPPYPESDCGHYKEGKEVFYKLLEILPGIKGKFLLSSYPSAELDKFRKENGYQYKDISLALGVDGKGNKGRKKTECLTRNYKTYDFFQDMFG